MAEPPGRVPLLSGPLIDGKEPSFHGLRRKALERAVRSRTAQAS